MINIQTFILILFAAIMGMMPMPMTANNSISWDTTPTSISSGANDISLNYSTNQKSIVVVQLFDENWDQIGQEYKSDLEGSGQITLTLTPDSTPSATNFLQAKLLDNNWSPPIQTLQTTVTYNPGGSGTNSLVWNPTPTSIRSGNNNIKLKYSTNQNAVVFVQIFDKNWDEIGKVYRNVSPGSKQITIPLSVSSPSANNNHLEAFLFSSDWNNSLAPRLDLTLATEQTSDCTTANGVCKIYPDTQNELLGQAKHYEANLHVNDPWNGPLKAFWGEPEGIFWVEWDNNKTDVSGSSSEEFDYKALRSEWTYDRLENGFPTRISQISRNDLRCEATGQWTEGSSGRCHINMTAWISENFERNVPCGTRCDIIIHTWDNSGTFKDKFTPEGSTDIGESKCTGQSVAREFRHLGTITENNITYDVLRTMPGGVGEKASYNIIPQNFRPNPLARFDTDMHYYNIDVKKFVEKLANIEATLANNTPVFNRNWLLQGMEWTVTGQSGDHGVPDSQGKWTFFNYKIPNISSNSNKVETDIQSMDFDVSPNPFTNSFNIEYDLTQTEPVSIQLFTQEGKRIKIIRNNENEAAGNHIETVNTSDLPSGIYLIHLTTSDSHGVQKLMKF